MFGWTGRVSAADLERAAEDLELIRVAGERTSVPRWRYRLLPAIAYAIARCPVYALRHSPSREAPPDSTSRPIFYAQFYPTCETALAEIKRTHPGQTIGFAGRRRYLVPFVRLGLALTLNLLSWSTLRHFRNVRAWRPWISDLLLYVLVGRWARRLLQGRPRSVIVFSHDHSPFEKAIARVANELGHDTVYVQHAAVTPSFPRLFATFSFLDGEQALEAYASGRGGEGTVVITGRQYRVCRLQSIRPTAKAILLCTSPIDEAADWRVIIDALAHEGYEISLRPHPAERSVQRWIDECAATGIRYLAPNEVSLMESLERSHFILAGTSAVLLEAGLAKRIPVLVEFERDLARGFEDHFGFLAEGIAWRVRPASALADFQEIERRVARGEAPAEPAYFDVACVARADTQQRALQAVLGASGGKPDLEAAGFVKVDSTAEASPMPPTWVPAEAASSWRTSRAASGVQPRARSTR